jgi:hypothetical protein
MVNQPQRMAQFPSATSAGLPVAVPSKDNSSIILWKTDHSSLGSLSDKLLFLLSVTYEFYLVLIVPTDSTIKVVAPDQRIKHKKGFHYACVKPLKKLKPWICITFMQMSTFGFHFIYQFGVTLATCNLYSQTLLLLLTVIAIGPFTRADKLSVLACSSRMPS